MNHLFIPLRKVDAAQRLVYAGIDETPDRARDVFDYATSKPYFEAWSQEMHKASGGKSYGNVRAMHGLTAAGRCDGIAYDDMAKRVDFVIHVVDDEEWKKVEAGVYTGISPGGKFAKRWKDPADPSLTRYTGAPSEISLVDVPCIPSATFEMVKADGATELRKFAPRAALAQVWATSDNMIFAKKADAERYQELTDANPAAFGSAEPRDELAKAIKAGEGAEAIDAVMAKARKAVEDADTLAPHLAKMADLPAAVIAAGDKIAIGKALGLDKTSDLPVLEQVMAKAAASGIKGKAPATTAADPAKLAKVTEAATAWGKVMGSAAPADLAKAVTAGDMKKGIWNVTDFGSVVMTIAYAASSASYEAAEEGDNSPIPARLKALAVEAASIFAAWAAEEANEAVAGYIESGDVVVAVMEMAAKLGDMAKASGKQTGANKDRLQAIHDHAANMGADCSTDMGKAVGVAEMKKVGDTLKGVLDMAKAAGAKGDDDLLTWLKTTVESLTTARARVTELEALPAAAKGVITGSVAVTKEQDNAPTLAKVAGDETIDAMAERLAKLSPEERAIEMTKLVHKTGGMRTAPV